MAATCPKKPKYTHVGGLSVGPALEVSTLHTLLVAPQLSEMETEAAVAQQLWWTR
jgi:hypothetical protein